MYKFKKIYLVFFFLFAIPALAMANFAYFPDTIFRVVGLIAIVSNILTTIVICGLFDISGPDNIFAYCGPDFAYSKTTTIILFFVIPSIYFLINPSRPEQNCLNGKEI